MKLQDQWRWFTLKFLQKVAKCTTDNRDVDIKRIVVNGINADAAESQNHRVEQSVRHAQQLNKHRSKADSK